jgi:glycosyltransferase involved in cell wall biosynthesis
MHKIAHIVESFENQAVENWLKQSYQYLIENNLINKEKIFFIETKESLNSKTLDFHTEFIDFNLSKILFIIKLYKFVKKEKIEILYSHHDITSGFYFLLKILLPIKTIMHCHNCSLVKPFSKKYSIIFQTKSFFLWVLNILLSDKIVCISEEVEICMRKYFHFNKKFIRNYYFHPRLPFSEFDSNKDGICYIGRLVPEKNPMRLLQIFNELVKTNSNIKLYIYGEGSEKKIMEHYVCQNGLSNKIIFKGWTFNPITAFKKHKIFLFPRFELPKEGFGLVFLEAQYANTFVLTSECYSHEVKISNGFYSISLDESNPIWAKKIDQLLQMDNFTSTFNKNIQLFGESNLLQQITYYKGCI